MNISQRINYRLLELRHLFKEVILKKKIYSKSIFRNKPSTDKNLVIATVDGTSYHGGMCDRFSGIISLYAYCKHKNLPFRIKYTHPFNLEDYLLPSKYDWTLKENEYTDNPKYIKILYMRGETLGKRLFSLKPDKQIHFYGNINCLKYLNEKCKGEEFYEWGTLFKELFKPGDILQEKLDYIRKSIGGEYNAAVFRFQNLLGDFTEYHFKSIDKEEANKIVDRCIETVKKLRDKDNKKLLVTSDSITFLRLVAEIDGICIIPGTLIHLDGQRTNIPENAFEVYMKSFLDFYTLSNANKIYRICTKEMYPSLFPVYAAKVNNIPFESINI